MRKGYVNSIVPILLFEKQARIIYCRREKEMDFSPRDAFTVTLERLSAEETDLEAKAAEVNADLSGLKDLDLLLRLADAKLSICLHLMEKIASGPSPSAGSEELGMKVREKAFSAIGILEGLMSENVSEDQRDAVSRDPGFDSVKRKLEEFILRGGGGFLEREAGEKASRALSRALVASLRRYSGEDDLYPPLSLEGLPSFLQRLFLALFPESVREDPARPPYGIREGEEIIYSSEKMKLPLSQAVFYMENELLPELRRKAAENPGDRSLQNEIAKVLGKMEEYKKLRFFPRSTPMFPERGYYSEGFTSYTADGEMLVPIPIPVSMKSGTNLDRKMELVRMDLVRRLAGKGVCRELDREYERLRSIESGIRGSSRLASLKVDAKWGFGVLRRQFPALGRLADKEGFKEFLRLATGGSARSRVRRVSAVLENENGRKGGLPLFIETSRTSPS